MNKNVNWRFVGRDVSYARHIKNKIEKVYCVRLSIGNVRPRSREATERANHTRIIYLFVSPVYNIACDRPVQCAFSVSLLPLPFSLLCLMFCFLCLFLCPVHINHITKRFMKLAGFVAHVANFRQRRYCFAQKCHDVGRENEELRLLRCPKPARS